MAQALAARNTNDVPSCNAFGSAPSLVPVALFAYARPEHLLRTLACLPGNRVPLIHAFSERQLTRRLGYAQKNGSEGTNAPSNSGGHHRIASDIDLTLIGQDLDLDTLGGIATHLDESPIPYQVDLSIFDQIDHPGLKAQIERTGKIFYQRHQTTLNP
ncbi:nucleotidyltransferase domain-containing protein [Thiocapsa marina]|uniref:DNA polymerase beta domain protein region n=1 Tax=Thiocapsa marina 5811 TaxID=768671 RepID=F9UBW0_9GAMM|nr:nucleotidyltransferase domain-containing protein [Thiocapsa marina]EGV18428.1 hypothetical protein ThimaDRAFT_2412 [Thiocapsa marina 5811]